MHVVMFLGIFYNWKRKLNVYLADIPQRSKIFWAKTQSEQNSKNIIKSKSAQSVDYCQ